MRWHEPHAKAIPESPLTDRGAGGCSSGNQSGGFAFPAIFVASYSLALPGTRTMPVGPAPAGWTASGILKAHDGSPSGTVSAVCAASVCTANAVARAQLSSNARREARRYLTAAL